MQTVKNQLNLAFNDKKKWNVFDNKILNELSSFKILKKIGEKSVYGSIYEIDNKQKYVVKIMKVDDSMKKKIFFNELRIGSAKRIKNFGTPIFAYTKINPKWYAYIMEHVLDGKQTSIPLTLDEYMKHNPIYSQKLKSNLKIKYSPNIFMHLAKTLSIFYKQTQGFHGDLHLGNIMVVLNKDTSIAKVVIIDYGTWTAFQNPLSQQATINTSLRHAHYEWRLLNINIENTFWKRASKGYIRSNLNTLSVWFQGVHIPTGNPFAGVLNQMMLATR
jgi:hypothetical protein